jgi:hypothetical protein
LLQSSLTERIFKNRRTKTTVVILNKNKLLAAYSASHEFESFGRKMLELLLAR